MNISFEQLSTDTFAKIKGFGIKSKSVYKTFRRTCRRLSAYLVENNLEFSFESGQKWLEEIRPCEPMTRSQYIMYSGQRRAVCLLSECQNGKLDSWKVYLQKTASRPKTEEYLRLLRLHEERLQIVGMAKATIDLALRVDSDFLIYLEKYDNLEINNISSRDVAGYFTQDIFSERKPDGVKAYAYKLKSFLEFLEDSGVVSEKKLSLAVPKVFAKQQSIVTVLSEKAVKALRNKDNEQGAGTDARNHAITLLALRLGVRRSDIIKMRLTDIDWKNDTISFIQQKTNVPITLPLLSDVGNALMDYILNFRPQEAGDCVFTRYYAPYQALSPGLKLKEYFSAFDAEDCPQHGFHILRRTCATGMLRYNIPRSVISASIGQVDPNSVDVYLSADEEKMRKCALSLSGIECGRGDLR